MTDTLHNYRRDVIEVGLDGEDPDQCFSAELRHIEKEGWKIISVQQLGDNIRYLVVSKKRS